MTITNILTHGDMRDSTGDDTRARDYINAATAVNGVIYIGDYSGIDCAVFNINKPAWYVQGNHPGCGKGNPNLFISNLLNTGIQAAFPGYDYNSFNWNQINQNKLSMVFVHINFVGRGCQHPVDQNLHTKINNIKNLIVGVCGHDHGSYLDPRTDRIYYIDPTPSSIQYCGTEPFLLGWLQIDTNTTGKTIFRYSRVDPGAGYKGVPTNWLKTVTVTTGPAPFAVTLTTNPGTIIQGQQVTLTATASGGTPGYTFSWTGLPVPCAQTNNNNPNVITCTPSNIGIYNLTVTSKDATNQTASSKGTLNVNPVSGSKFTLFNIVSDFSGKTKGIDILFNPSGNLTLQQACAAIPQKLTTLGTKFYIYDVADKTSSTRPNVGVQILENPNGSLDVTAASTEACKRLSIG